MNEVGVGIDQNFFVHGQPLQLDHAVVDPLFRRERHAGQGLPDVEHPGVHLILAAFQLGQVQHVLDEPGQTAGLLADQLQIMVLHVGRDGAVQNAVDEALDGGHRGAQLVGDVAHELAARIVVGLDIFGHLVEGVGQVHDLAFALDPLDADREISSAEPLRGLGDLLQRVGEPPHQDACQHTGAEQHDAGREEEVRPELILEIGQPCTGRAQEEIAAASAVVVHHFPHGNVAFFGQDAIQRAQDMVGLLIPHPGHQGLRHGILRQLRRVGGDEDMAVLIGQEQIGLGALADDLQLGAQRVQFLALGQGRLLDYVVRRPPGDLGHAV